MGFWHLSFRTPHGQGSPTSTLTSALQDACGCRLHVSLESPTGNPRDGYGAWRNAEGTRGEVEIRAQIAYEQGQGADLGAVDTSWVKVRLQSPDARAMDRLWTRLTEAFAVLGYRDDTLEHGSSAIVDDLVAAGDLTRASALRAAITEALIRRLQSDPRHATVHLTFCRADDLDRVLRAAPAPAEVRGVNLSGCDLTRLPRGLAEHPVLFPGLERLILAYTRLTTLPDLPLLYPSLRHVVIPNNGMKRPRGKIWKDVKVEGG